MRFKINITLLDFVESLPTKKPDKYDLGYIHEFYSEVLTPFKDTCSKILEIGIQYGLSMLLWKEYFINAEVYGIDTEYCHHVTNSSRLHPYFLDAYTQSSVGLFVPESFDVVIDDGPHTLESMIFFCRYYLPLVKPGGVFVVEDIIDTTWTPILLNIIGKKYNTKVYNMTGKCLTKKLNDTWINGLDVIVVKK